MPQMGVTETLFGSFLIFLLISLVLFLLGRELMCWYFKINERIGQLERIESSLTALSKALRENTRTSGSGGGEGAKGNSCPACGATNGAAMKFCQSCGQRLA